MLIINSPAVDDFAWVHEVSAFTQRTDKIAYLKFLARAGHIELKGRESAREPDTIDVQHVGGLRAHDWTRAAQHVDNLRGTRTPALEPSGTLVLAALDQIHQLHATGEYRAASDTLLTFLDACLDKHDYAMLDVLLQSLSEQLETGAQQYENDCGQARLLNALAMTAEIQKPLPGRKRLRSTFYALLAKHSGPAYADRLLANV